MTGFDLLPPMLRGMVVAAAVALVVNGIARLAKRERLAAAAAGIGLMAGFVAVLGIINATPRQLAERLPLLAALGLAAGGLASLRHRAARLAGVALGLLGGAWWMAGAPLHPATLLQAAPVALALLAGMGLAWWRGTAMGPMGWAWVALAAGLMAAAARGPQAAFALAGLGAVLGAAAVRAVLGPAARLPLAVCLAGVAAVPMVARAAPADFAAAAAPALALLAGPLVGGRLPRRLAGLGAAIAALPAIGLAWLLR